METDFNKYLKKLKEILEGEDYELMKYELFKDKNVSEKASIIREELYKLTRII